MRPYFNESASDLDDLAHEHWGDLTLLLDVAIELCRRRTAYARSLRTELIRRVAELVLDGFPWPTTDAPGGAGQLEDKVDWPTEGLLGFVGYRVGRNGSAESERREILDAVYCEELPPVNSAEYMTEWGRPRTALRLQKLAESVAAFTRNAKRNRTVDLSQAVDDWDADLDYLRQEYYVGRYDFPWPGTQTGY